MDGIYSTCHVILYRGLYYPGCIGGDSCCSDGICADNEGDCDDDADCQSGLVCGTDNCVGASFQSTDDCCTAPAGEIHNNTY